MKLTCLVIQRKFLLIKLPAQILEHILKQAWQLEDNDKDMIVMYHEFKFRDNLNKEKTIVSTMGCIGEDSTFAQWLKL